MIKSVFLHRKIKTKTGTKEHSTYQEANYVGILYNEDEFESSIIDELIANFKLDQKKVRKLGYSENLQNTGNDGTLLFTKKDISNIGKIKKRSVNFFINQTFDFLLSLDTSEDIHYKYILAKSEANCKIGLETESYRSLLSLFMKPEDEKQGSARSLVKYLKMI